MTGAILALAGTLLAPGQPVAFELAPGGVGVHTFELPAGHFVRASVVQQGTDLAVVLVAPDGARTDVDATGSHGREPVSILARIGGVYRIELRSAGAPVAARYAIESDVPRLPDHDDRKRLGAERAMAEAAALVRRDTPEARRASLGKFEAALFEWRALHDERWEAIALVQRAAARPAAGQYPESREDAQGALQLFRRLGDRWGEARALLLIGESYDYQDDWDSAITFYRQALEREEALDDPEGEAWVLSRLGWAHGERGETKLHLEIQHRVVELYRRRGDRVQEGWSLINLGSAHGAVGDYQRTLASLREARETFRAAGDHVSEALALQRLGSFYESLGDYDKSVAASEEALAMFRADKHTEGQIDALLTMGVAHAARDDAATALHLYSEALRIGREAGDTWREAYALARIGSAEIALRRYEPAARHVEEALKLAVERKESGTETDALSSLGMIQLEKGRIEEARASFQRVAERSRQFGNEARLAKALYSLGRIANGSGDLDQARAHTEAALELIEAVHQRLTSPALRSSYVASARTTYELYVDVLMGLHRRQPGLGFDERALEAAEKARARGLVDGLIEGGLNIREGVDPSLLEAERAILDRLGAALERQQRRSEAAHEEQARSAARTVQLLTAEWDAVRADIKARSPRFAELRDPVPPTAASIRHDLLDDDTALLEYALGEKRSFLWVVGRRALSVFELPGRAEIDQAAREAYAQLGEPVPSATGSDGLLRLSRMVLGPARAALTAKRLLIVADGALHYVSFAALPDPGGSGDPLLARHEVVAAPSAAVVALLRRETAGRRRAPKTMAVLADPVFDRQDQRLGGRASHVAPAPADAALASALRSAGLDGLPRLVFTRREAGAILSLVPARQRKAALDFDASRSTVTDASLADFRFVHFATHGFLNSAQPALSGLVLSLFDRDGAETRGFLTATDAFNLRLNADMVVLSGCRTALGEETRGEGLVGLRRAFMYAGAPRVVASLWKVDDAATAELMTRFYHGILKQRLAPSAALRAAQLDLLRRPRFRHPFYWAAFQLQGEWR